MLAQNIFDRRWSYYGWKTRVENKCEVFNFGDLCGCVSSLWSTITQTVMKFVKIREFFIKRKMR